MSTDNVCLSRHKQWISRDNYKRKFFLKNLFKRTYLKALKVSRLTTFTRRYLAYMYLVRMPRFSSYTFLNRRCIISGRVWSTNKKTSLSRFELRKEVYKANIPGFRRASW